MVKRNIDHHNLIYHPKRVTEWLEKGDCFPIYVEIGPTNRCNHKCIFCALDFIEHKGHNIEKGVMLKTLENMANNGVLSVMFAGEGEPLLHENISEFVQYSKKSGLAVAMTSNGILFDEKKALECLPYLTWVRFSVDAGTRENYAKIHRTKPGDFDKIVRNIKTAADIKREQNLNANISAQYLMIPENIGEVLTFSEIMKNAGADNIQIKPYSQHPNSINKFAVNYEEYVHLEKELEKFNSDRFGVFFRKRTIKRLEEGISYKECLGAPFFALIDSKGDVVPCNLFYDKPEFVYGNLYENSFSEIWKGDKRKEVLRKLKEKGVEECREICRLDACNKYLADLGDIPEYARFI